MLSLESIEAAYGASQVLFDLSLKIAEGEVVALLGRNGSGKTTTTKCIIGILPIQTGAIWFKQRRIDGLRPHQICRLGIGFVPEDRRIFPDLTVEENLRLPAVRREEGGSHWRLTERVYELFPALADMRHRKGRHLSGGEQQMLAIGRALMTNPKVLVLDEPVEGLAPVIVQGLLERLQELKRQGLSMMLCEQYLEFAELLADRMYVLDRGHVVFHGTVREFAGNDELKKRYLTV